MLLGALVVTGWGDRALVPDEAHNPVAGGPELRCGTLVGASLSSTCCGQGTTQLTMAAVVSGVTPAMTRFAPRRLERLAVDVRHWFAF
jgi:hypothetical protein